MKNILSLAAFIALAAGVYSEPTGNLVKFDLVWNVNGAESIESATVSDAKENFDGKDVTQVPVGILVNGATKIEYKDVGTVIHLYPTTQGLRLSVSISLMDESQTIRASTWDGLVKNALAEPIKFTLPGREITLRLKVH